MAIYKRGRGFELGATEKQTQIVARAGLEPETAGLRVRRADHSATLPPVYYSCIAEITKHLTLISLEQKFCFTQSVRTSFIFDQNPRIFRISS